MFLPIRTDSPLRSTPYMNWALIVFNVVAYGASSLWPDVAEPYKLYSHDPDLVAFISYAFLHGNLPHLIFNMLFLFIFGNNVNDRMGHIGYLAFYLAGAAFAGVGFVLTQPGSSGVVGASGAVAAVTGAYLVLFPRSTITVAFIWFIIGSFEIPSLYFVAFFFLKDLIFWAGQSTGVAYNAHVSGTLYGFTVCLVLLSVQLLPRDTFDVLALIQRWNKRRQYRDMVNRGYNPFGYAPGRDPNRPETHAPADPKVQRTLDLRAQISDAVAAHDLPRAAKLYLDLKALDAQQVLSRQSQLDVANQLAGDQMYPQAAEAYESFLRHYPKSEQVEQVELMLGLIYARYLQRYDRANDLLEKAASRIHGERELSMARSELSRIKPLLAPQVQRGPAA